MDSLQLLILLYIYTIRVVGHLGQQGLLCWPKHYLKQWPTLRCVKLFQIVYYPHFTSFLLLVPPVVYVYVRDLRILFQYVSRVKKKSESTVWVTLNGKETVALIKLDFEVYNNLPFTHPVIFSHPEWSESVQRASSLICSNCSLYNIDGFYCCGVIIMVLSGRTPPLRTPLKAKVWNARPIIITSNFFC